MTTEELVANHGHFAVGQEFIYLLSNEDEMGRRIVEVDRRLSVTLLKVEGLHGWPEAHWESAGVFVEWILERGAKLR